LDVIEKLNFGLHTHVEHSGLSLELITIFEKFGQNWQKIAWVILGGYNTQTCFDHPTLLYFAANY